jgi:hypothetical protein
VTEDDERLKPPPGLVEGLKQLGLPPDWAEKLALPPHHRLPSRPSVPRQVLRDTMNWLITHDDGDPQVVRKVRAWLAEHCLDPSTAAELYNYDRRVAAAAPKRNQSSKRVVLWSILRELQPPDGPPASVTTYKLERKIAPLWAKTWSRFFPRRKPPPMPGKGAIAAARAALKNLPR